VARVAKAATPATNAKRNNSNPHDLTPAVGSER
jgi:hypothetical protein